MLLERGIVLSYESVRRWALKFGPGYVRRLRHKALRRSQVASSFSTLPPSLIGMEACAMAHHWARTHMAFGHEVRLIPPAYVKPYPRRQKNDAADAAICEAVTRPSMRFDLVKSPQQQSTPMLQGARDLLIGQRTALISALHGHFAELGIVLAQGLGTRAN